MCLEKYQALFKLAQHISPELKGELGASEPGTIAIDQDSEAVLASLHQYLQLMHPEAGKAYWLTRCWSMISWQPVYLAFVGVYGVQAMPNVSQIAQRFESGEVAGFKLPLSSMVEGDKGTLISEAGLQLIRLIDHLIEQLNSVVRIRPGFARNLLADLILANMVKLQRIEPELSEIEIYHDARLWLEALELPSKRLSSLVKTQDSPPLILKRFTCCLHYKRHDGGLCEACPRLHHKRAG